MTLFVIVIMQIAFKLGRKTWEALVAVTLVIGSTNPHRCYDTVESRRSLKMLLVSTDVTAQLLPPWPMGNPVICEDNQSRKIEWEIDNTIRPRAMVLGDSI